MELPEVHRVHEGDVVGWVPVQAVAVQVEGHGVYQPVDGSHHLRLHREGGTSEHTDHWLTSSPFCCAGQLEMAREPEMKSFCTSTMMIAVRGLTI